MRRVVANHGRCPKARCYLMSEDLDVRWQRARQWLDSVRSASARIEPLIREIAAMQDAYDSMLPWQTSGSGSGGLGTHSDPTMTQALARTDSFATILANKRAKLETLYDVVGNCGRILTKLGDALTDSHSLALELYYIDCAETWSSVADELGVSRTKLWQLRDESYEWIECRFT